MRRKLLLLREMRDAAVTIRDLIGDRTAEEIDADPCGVQRCCGTSLCSGRLPARSLSKRKTPTLRSHGAQQPVCATESFTATGISMSRPW